jgi:hypothetical protein
MDEQKKPEEIKKDKAKESVDLFQDFKTNTDRVQWEKEISEDIEFVNNVQLDDETKASLEAANMPADAINVMKPTRDQVIQQLTDNDPRWTASAVENSDTKVAGDASDFLSYLWHGSKGKMRLRKSVEDIEDTGLFCMMAYFDPEKDWGKGDICVTDINPKNIYIDPRTTDRNARNAPDIFIATVLSLTQVKQDYPKFNFKDAQSVPYNYLDTPKSGTVQQGQVFNSTLKPDEDFYLILDHYKKISIDRFLVYDPISQYEELLTEEEYIEYAKEIALIVNKLGEQLVVTDEQEIKRTLSNVQQFGNIYHYMMDGSIMQGVESPQPEADGNTAMPNSTIMVTETTKGALLQEGLIKYEVKKVPRIQRRIVIGEKFYFEDTLPISNYPFGITMLHHTRTPYPYGDARIAKPIQKQINKFHSLIVGNAINNTNVKVFIPTGNVQLKKEMEERWGKAGAQFFEVDMETGAMPVVVYPGQFPNALYQHIDRLTLHIQKLYGAYEFQDGQTSQAPQTKGGTLLLDEMGMRRSKSKRELIEEALDDLASVISEYIPYVYTYEKIIRIVEPNGKAKEIAFNKKDNTGKIVNDLSANRYDFRIISGSTLPSNRWARFEVLKDAWINHMLQDPRPALQLLDLPNIDEIIEREDMVKTMQQQMGQMQEQIKQLSGQLQTKSREVIQAQEKVEVQKFSTTLDKIANKAESAVVVGQARIGDAIKNNKNGNSKEKSKE